MSRVIRRKPKYLLILLFIVFAPLVGYSSVVHAKPFLKCYAPTHLSYENGENGLMPNFFCVNADGTPSGAAPNFVTVPNEGFFNVKTRCPAGTLPWAELDGLVYWVYCNANTTGGGGHEAPGSVPPTSFELPATPPAPTGEPSDSTDETGGSSGDSEEDIGRGNGFTETDCSDIKNSSDQCGMVNMANAAIKFLSAIVGVVVVAMLISGGVRYVSAGSDPQAVAKAKEMIRNAIFAIIVFMFLYGFLDWIIPGGLL